MAPVSINMPPFLLLVAGVLVLAFCAVTFIAWLRDRPQPRASSRVPRCEGGDACDH